jgi:N-acetylmuramoyl-L-alanine amidase
VKSVIIKALILDKTNQNKRILGNRNKASVFKMKRLIVFFGILCLLSLLPENALADRRGFVNTVVIDPGHGGRDPGAVGRKLREKDIALAISLKLGEYIKESLPDVKVVYTRTTDEFVELWRRAQIANESQADLFISIHCNSARNPSATGTETFVMGLHRSQANLEVARKENASILFEEDYMDTYEGFDPHSPEANIIFTLYQNAYLDQSLSVASMVQGQFRDRARRIDRGVKQAGFLVLYQITMPGILVEAGFLSNPREEEYLASETGQAHIASAIFRAFREYKEQQDALAASRRYYAAADQADNQPATVSTPRPEPGQHQTVDVTRQSADEIVFRVQFASTREKMPLDAPEFKGLQNVGYYFHEGLYKYTVGNEKTLEDAAVLQSMVHKSGFRDAFVVAFVNEQRISPSEAIRLISQREFRP